MLIEKEFNLLKESWIPLMREDGGVVETSLIEAFRDAHLYKEIAGDVPAQDAVLVRLMLSVLYCVYLRKDVDGTESQLETKDQAIERWEQLWNRGQFDADLIEKYLFDYEERFYLFHPERPFYQVNIDKGTQYTAAKLNGTLSESGNKPRLFSLVNGEAKNYMGYSEAARWLLYLNYFDDTSSKPSVRGQNMPSTGAGWLGKLGMVMLTGSNLFQTLMLNFVLANEMGVMHNGPAVWELDEVSSKERVEIPIPESPQELLTLQCRRILLNREGDKVTGYLLLGGDVIPKENALIEQMTMWRQNDDNVLTPRRHDTSRAMWRDYASLLVRSQISGKGKEPGVIRWASDLVDDGIIKQKDINIRAVGVKYADKDFFVDDLIDDSLRINTQLLSNMNDGWNNRIDATISKTENCVSSLGKYAWNVATINGLDENGVKKQADKARSAGYQALDQPFRRWLTSIDPDTDDMETKMNEWDASIRRILLNEGKRMLEQSGEKALIGKIDGDKPKNAFTAYRFFKNDIMKKTGGVKNE